MEITTGIETEVTVMATTMSHAEGIVMADVIRPLYVLNILNRMLFKFPVFLILILINWGWVIATIYFC